MTRLEELIQAQCPNGVRYATFPEVCTYIRGITYNKSQEVADTVTKAHKVLRANNITLASNTLNFDDVKCVASEVRVKDKQWLKGGDILMCASSGSQEHVGKVAYIEEDMDYTFGGFMAVIRCNCEINSRYMFHLLSSSLFAKHLKDTLKSKLIKTLNAEVMNAFTFPVPPLEVQEEIVKNLDNYAKKNNNLIAALSVELEARKKQYEYYRDLLLTSENESAKNVKIDGQRRSAVEWMTLGDLIESLHTGLNPRKNFVLNSAGSDCPYITGKDIYGNKINVTEKTDMISRDVVALINKRAKLEPGLLLFASTGTGTVGRMAIIEEYNNDWNMSETLYALKVKDSLILAKYLMFALYSGIATKQFEPKITKGSVPHLKVADLLSVMIPVPNLKEQHEIVAKVERLTEAKETLCQALIDEIFLRKQQYSYYEQMLFSFPKAS